MELVRIGIGLGRIEFHWLGRSPSADAADDKHYFLILSNFGFDTDPWITIQDPVVELVRIGIRISKNGIGFITFDWCMEIA